MRLSDEELKKLNIKIAPLKKNVRVQEMKRYIQHGRVTTYDHVKDVTIAAYWLNKRLHLHSDEDALLRGAFLHDFYLYDWHEGDNGNGLHGFSHPHTAMRNAKKEFHINELEQDIISHHMWPLNFKDFPKSREAWIVCLADKYVATKETIFNRRIDERD